MSKRRALFHLDALPHTALAFMALGVMNATYAQTGDPVRGKTLFELKVNTTSGLRNCEDCHGTAAVLYSLYSGMGHNEASTYNLITNGINSVAIMAPYRTLWGTQERLDVAAYLMRGPHVTAPPPPPPPPPPPSGTPTPATPSASPNPMLFSSTSVGSNSSVVGVLLTNSSASAVTFASVPVTFFSGDTTDFVVGTPPSGSTACQAGTVLAAGMSCSFGVRFSPQAAGARFAVWNINFTGGVTARQLSLQGTALAAPTPTPTPPPPSSSSAPAQEGGGATGGLALAGLLVALGLRRRPRDS